MAASADTPALSSSIPTAADPAEATLSPTPVCTLAEGDIGPLSETPVPELDELIKALAHPARREILAWLKTPEAAFGEQHHPFSLGVCAGKIFEKAALSQSTVSAHLATLQKAGLVSTRKVGQWIFYSRNEAAITQFLHQLQADL